MFTKWVEIIPVKNKVATTIEKEFHRKIISKWGTPRILYTDNGKEFVNRVMVKLTQNFGIRHSKHHDTTHNQTQQKDVTDQ